ncbi:hypothetical protein AGOR_G00136490 [Albula goreensis]|uniref:Uncharacterized protein n=1 Tax=Albula goreensis TaxID=1534307 RepID=A0A8T3DAF0_9TELE|nr:hypothetical protein AGOR_G00136490 [Albula goreensis]
MMDITLKIEVLLLSAQNRKLSLQWAQAHQNWTVKDWQNVTWSDVSQLLLRHTDGRCGVGIVFLTQFWSINTNQSLLKCHSLFEYCC